MPRSSKPQLVLVTGANGYIASTLIKTLLEQRYKVRGTVRDLSNEKVASLKTLPNASTHLELFPLELTGPEVEFHAAMDNAEWVMHVASPIPAEHRVDSDQEYYINPAVEGTLKMLRAARRNSTVRKFVLTSSIDAVTKGHVESKTDFTEEDWSKLDGPCMKGYEKSKTMAEQAAWKFMEEFAPSFTLSVIIPSYVLGPVLSSTQISSSSNRLLGRLLRGKDPGCINMLVALVDVRDVARAHIQAATIPEAAGKRFMVNGGELLVPEIATVLRQEFGSMGYTIPKLVMPKWFVWLLTWFDADLATIYPLIDKEWHLDNLRSRDILQLDYTSVEQTIVEGGHSLLHHGLVSRSSA